MSYNGRCMICLKDGVVAYHPFGHFPNRRFTKDTIVNPMSVEFETGTAVRRRELSSNAEIAVLQRRGRFFIPEQECLVVPQ